MSLKEDRRNAAKVLWWMRQRTRWAMDGNDAFYWMFSAGRWSMVATSVVQNDPKSVAQVNRIVTMHGNRLPVSS